MQVPIDRNAPNALCEAPDLTREVHGPDGTLPAVSLQQPLALAGTPGFVPALRDGWHDAP